MQARHTRRRCAGRPRTWTDAAPCRLAPTARAHRQPRARGGRRPPRGSLRLPWCLHAIGEAGAKLVERDPDPPLDGAESHFHRSGNRGLRVAAVVGELDGLALLGWQLGERLANLLAAQLERDRCPRIGDRGVQRFTFDPGIEPRRQTARKDSCTTSSAAPRSLRMRRATVWARPPYRSYKASIPSGERAEIERTMSSSLRCTFMLRHTLGGCASVGTRLMGRLDHPGTRHLEAAARAEP